MPGWLVKTYEIISLIGTPTLISPLFVTTEIVIPVDLSLIYKE